MADVKTSESKPAPRRRGGWWRVLLGAVAIIVLLLVVVYFVATSSSFVQHQILPRVSKSLGADVTVSSAEVHPFSRVVLHDLKVQATNQPALLTAPEASVSYSLMDIIGGNIHVDDLTITSPTIQIVQNADGTSNLDPFTKKEKNGKTETAKAGSGKSKPLKVDVRKVTISNATILQVKNHENGTRDLVELTNVAVALTGLKNGESGKLTLSAILRDENNPPAPAMYGLLQAKVDGSFNFAFTPDLKPSQVSGDAHLEISQAAGSFSEFAQLMGILHCDMSPTEIKDVSLNFEKGGVRLGELRAHGPFDSTKTEGKLSVEMLAVDKKVLNLLGAKSGFDFGSTTITLTNEVELAKGGESIAAVGELSASKFQLSRTNLSTPALDLRTYYNVAVDKAGKKALINTLNVSGVQNGKPLLSGSLTSPMTLAWGSETNAVGDSAFGLTVTQMNLADWKIFLGDLVSAGLVDVNLKLLSQQGGNRLTFDATNQISNLAANLGGQQLSQTTVSLSARGDATNLKQFNLGSFALDVSKSNRSALSISGSGTYDIGKSNADLQIALKTSLPRLLPLVGQTNFAVTAGTAELNAHVTQAGQAQAVTGTLVVTNFTGTVSGNAFTDFSTAMALDVAKTAEQIEIRKASGTLAENRKAGGSFEVTGNYSTGKAPSQLNLKLSGINENGLRAIVAPMLTGKKLVSVAVNGTASAQFSANGDSAVKADLQVTNIVVNDPARPGPATPLEAKLLADASVVKHVAEVRQLQLTLTPTQRAKNQFNLQGHVDMSKTNAWTGNLSLSSDGLDLTTYYDLFAGTNKPAAVAQKASGAPAASAANASKQTTAATNQLPFRNFTVDAKVAKFYLREIEATNFQTTVKVDGGRVVLKPFQLTLNGSPMLATADVDMGVPGYKYAVTFNTTNVPFAPLWNTFNPTEKGQVGGTLSANVNLSGVGFEGESLQKTLAGTFEIGTTNLNLDVNKIKSPILSLIVSVVVAVPDLFGNNPTAAISRLGSTAAGKVLGEYSGGLADEVSKSPIDIISARGSATNGVVKVDQAVVRSTIFESDVTGTETLAPVLTNSPLNLQVSILLSQPVAQESRLANIGATNAAGYVKLPDFLVIKGTQGDPKASISVAALGKGLIQQFVPGLGGGNGTNGSGNLLQGVGNLLRGGGGNTNSPNQSTTNQPSTNQSPVNNLLNRILK
jgi:hypothetical protein